MSGIKNILDKYGVRPRKRFGQNFLIHDNYLDAIADVAAVQGEYVLEIGAGIGNLTKKLAERAEHVYAVEFDRDVLRALRAEAIAPNIEIIEADALKLDYRKIAPGKKLVAVANLPYNIATEIVFRLLDAGDAIKRMLLMTQLEVAKRFSATSGNKDYGVLAVLAGVRADMRIAMKIPPGAFYPKPEVDSAIVRFDILEKPPVDFRSYDMFAKIVRAAFNQRRKTVLNSLHSGFAADFSKEQVAKWLEASGIDPKLRAENLSREDFAKLERNYYELGNRD